MAERRHQLGFPWCEEALVCVAAEDLRGAAALHIEVLEGHDEAALRLSVASKYPKGHFWYSEDRFEVRILMAHPV